MSDLVLYTSNTDLWSSISQNSQRFSHVKLYAVCYGLYENENIHLELTVCWQHNRWGGNILLLLCPLMFSLPKWLGPFLPSGTCLLLC